jgi:BirA family biotin operon repressor/biotin-[acetyl-CoA-carboxylase] ligase
VTPIPLEPIPLEPIPLETVAEIGSTSAALKTRAEAGAPETALRAGRQTQGRGRQGRPWRSIDGNLYLSVLLRPAALPHPGHWSLLTAVALLDAARPYASHPNALRLKWPNDLLLNDGKLAGILLEAGFSPAPWLVIGIGVNLAGAPQDLGRPVASLNETGTAPDPQTFARHLLTALTRWRRRYETEGFPPIRTAWLAAGPPIGQALTVTQGETTVTGAFHGLADNGALRLNSPGGAITLLAGEVEEQPASPSPSGRGPG